MRKISTLGIVLFMLMLYVSGCASKSNPKAEAPKPEPPKEIDPERLQGELMDFADSLVSNLCEDYDDLATHSKSQLAKRYAQERKLNTARGAYINATGVNPSAGLINMLVLVNLQYLSCDDPWFVEYYGADGKALREDLARHDRFIWAAAQRYLTDQQIQELRASIAAWRVRNVDQRSVSLVRLTDFPEVQQLEADVHKSGSSGGGGGSGGRGSVFSLLFLDPFSNLNPAIRELERSRAMADRMFYYAERLPDIWRWQAEAFYTNVSSDPRFDQALNYAGQFSTATTKFSDVTAKLPKDIASLQTQAARDIAQILIRQREEAVKQLAAATAIERDAALKQFAELLSEQQSKLVNNFQSATNDQIDHLTHGLMLVSLIMIVPLILLLLIVHKLGQRSARSKATEPTSSPL